MLMKKSNIHILFTFSCLEYFSPGVGFLPLSISSSLPSCKDNNLVLHGSFVVCPTNSDIVVLFWCFLLRDLDGFYINATSIALLIASLSSSTSKITRESDSR